MKTSRRQLDRLLDPAIPSLTLDTLRRAASAVGRTLRVELTGYDRRNYGYGASLTDGRSLDAQVRQLRAAGAEKMFRETASGARADRAQLRRVLAQLDKGDVVTVMRLDRLARSIRDLFNTLATIAAKGAGFRSLGDTWADTTTAHGRLMLNCARRPCGVRARINPRPHWRRARTRQGKRREDRAQAEAHRSPETRGGQAPRFRDKPPRQTLADV